MEWSVDILLPFVQLHLYLSFLTKTASEHKNYAIIFTDYYNTGIFTGL